MRPEYEALVGTWQELIVDGDHQSRLISRLDAIEMQNRHDALLVATWGMTSRNGVVYGHDNLGFQIKTQENK